MVMITEGNGSVGGGGLDYELRKISFSQEQENNFFTAFECTVTWII